MPEIAIREIRERDAEQTAALLNAVIHEGRYTIMVEPITVEEQVEWIKSLADRSACYVAEGADQSILGIQSIEPMSAAMALRHVGDISTFVADSAHRQGIGRQLADAALPRAKEIGYSKLIAMIRGDNPRAQAYYMSIGFTPIGTAKRHALVRGEFIDEVLMERFL